MKEIIEYKGYKGSVHISTENNCLYGEVLGLPKNTKITYLKKDRALVNLFFLSLGVLIL